jgi:hypothetical protein
LPASSNAAQRTVRFAVAEGVLGRSVGDDLLVHLFETDDVFVLNRDARVVFEAVKESSSVDELHAHVASRVFGDALELNQLVDTALERMVAAGILVRTVED